VWGISVAHSNRCNFRCNIDELGGVIQWPTHIGVILGAILVNQVGCLSGPLEWVQFWV
jgi:hypothetical protein